MGQIVQYGHMGNTKRERTLKWIDKTKSGSDEKSKPLPLAKLIPI